MKTSAAGKMQQQLLFMHGNERTQWISMLEEDFQGILSILRWDELLHKALKCNAQDQECISKSCHRVFVWMNNHEGSSC